MAESSCVWLMVLKTIGEMSSIVLPFSWLTLTCLQPRMLRQPPAMSQSLPGTSLHASAIIASGGALEMDKDEARQQ